MHRRRNLSYQSSEIESYSKTKTKGDILLLRQSLIKVRRIYSIILKPLSVKAFLISCI